MQQAPPNDYSKIPVDVDAPPEMVDFSGKEAMKIDCNAASPDERATIQKEIPLEKIPPIEKASVPEVASIKRDAPSDTTETETAFLVESPPPGIDSKGLNIQIGDNSEYLTAMKYALVQDAEAFDDRKCHIVKNIFIFEKPQNVLSLGNIWMASEMPYDNFFGYVQPKVQISLDTKRDFSDDIAKRTRFNDLEKGVYYRLIQYYYGLFSENLNFNERAIILLYALRSNPNLSWAYLEIFEHFPDDADEYEKLAKNMYPRSPKNILKNGEKLKSILLMWIR